MPENPYRSPEAELDGRRRNYRRLKHIAIVSVALILMISIVPPALARLFPKLPLFLKLIVGGTVGLVIGEVASRYEEYIGGQITHE